MLCPAFWAQNRMVARVLAETTKVKNNFINGKKKFKRKLSGLIVEGEEFKLRICLREVGSVACYRLRDSAESVN